MANNSPDLQGRDFKDKHSVNLDSILVIDLIKDHHCTAGSCHDIRSCAERWRGPVRGQADLQLCLRQPGHGLPHNPTAHGQRLHSAGSPPECHNPVCVISQLTESLKAVEVRVLEFDSHRLELVMT